MTLYLRSTLPNFPSPPPRQGLQRSEHCPQSFAPRITRQHVWVGTPGHYGARSGSLSPYSILLHRPCEVSQEYACALPGRNALNERVLGHRGRAGQAKPHVDQNLLTRLRLDLQPLSKNCMTLGRMVNNLTMPLCGLIAPCRSEEVMKNERVYAGGRLAGRCRAYTQKR